MPYSAALTKQHHERSPRCTSRDFRTISCPPIRDQALKFIQREAEAAREDGLTARLLVPLTRGHQGGPALQFEVEIASLDQLDQFRNRGVKSPESTGNWMKVFSEVLTAPPCVEILRVDEAKTYGSSLPGLSRPCGSSAALIRRIRSSSAPPRQSGIM